MTLLSENLKMLRENHGLTQAEVATILQTNKSTYNRYEKIGIEPDIESLKRLSNLYSVTIDSLVGHTVIPNEVSIQEIRLQKDLEQAVSKMVREVATAFINSQEKEITQRIMEQFHLPDGKEPKQ